MLGSFVQGMFQSPDEYGFVCFFSRSRFLDVGVGIFESESTENSDFSCVLI